MNKEFVPHKQSLSLKELGFDENCFKYYNEETLSTVGLFYTYDNPMDFKCLAPLYQQAFRWFREKCRLFSSIQELNIGYQHSYYFVVNDEDSIQFLKYEDAELACLDKLISILKEQQNETF